MKTWIKAGLFGGIAGIILTLPAFLAFYLPLGLGSIVSTCASIIFLLLYPGVGMLAAFWLPRPRIAKQGAIDGALAGLLAFSIDSVATIIITFIITAAGGMEQYLQQLAPYFGGNFTPAMLERTNTLVIGLIMVFSCISVLLGALFSALGGWVFASVKPD